MESTGRPFVTSGRIGEIVTVSNALEKRALTASELGSTHHTSSTTHIYLRQPS